MRRMCLGTSGIPRTSVDAKGALGDIGDVQGIQQTRNHSEIIQLSVYSHCSLSEGNWEHGGYRIKRRKDFSLSQQLGVSFLIGRTVSSH